MMDGHGQPALLYIVPFTLGKWLLIQKNKYINSHMYIIWTWRIILHLMSSHLLTLPGWLDGWMQAPFWHWERREAISKFYGHEESLRGIALTSNFNLYNEDDNSK